jgi:D-tyrosyl-tRNA(Tyr) deacylase
VRAVVQRVSSASVDVDGRVVGAIGRGVCVLLGIASGDDEDDAGVLASRVARLRIFENEEGKLDRNVLDVAGEALVVSQFTLVAESRRHKGTRPDFSRAARRDDAERLYERFSEELRRLGVQVATGEFGARMRLELVNDGPVTIVLDAGKFP